MRDRAKILSQNGFTLIELLIAMAISLVLMTGIYTTYRSQQKAYIVQDQMAQMQQNLRAAMYFVEADLRMAGYNADQEVNLGMTVVNSDAIGFTLFGDGQCNPNENGSIRLIQYDIYTSGTYGGPTLGIRCSSSPDPGASREPIAPFIETLNFVYLTGNGTEYDPLNDNLGDIRSVEVTMVARAEKEDRDYSDSKTFSNARGALTGYPRNDHFRRMSLTKRIRCRNLGL